MKTFSLASRRHSVIASAANLWVASSRSVQPTVNNPLLPSVFLRAGGSKHTSASQTRGQRMFFPNTALTSRRHYTQGEQKKEDTQDQHPEGTQTPTQTEGAGGDESTLTPEQKKIKELEELSQSLKDDYLRCLADKQNLLRITKIDVDNAKLFGIKSFATSMLEVADNLERALATVSEEKRQQIPELDSLYTGLAMTEKVMLQVLERNGVKKFVPLNEKFDPNLHSALFEVNDPSKPPGSVAIVQAAGFSLNGRLLRPAQVGVVSSQPQSGQQ